MFNIIMMNFPEIYQQYMYSYPHKTAYGPLPEISISDYLSKASKKPLSLYFHIPFCESKCGYCNLFSVIGQKEDMMENYLNAMEIQAEQYLESAKTSLYFNNLTIGGGTPLLLSEKQLERLFQISHRFSFLESSSFVSETSPRQTTKEKLDILKKNGISRISIGVQSFHQKELENLNRRHSVFDCKKALDEISMAGFSYRNIDLIYGILGQDKQSLKYSIDTALFYDPEELFLYPLYIKQGTGLFNKKVSASKQTYQLYQFISPYLKEHGYTQISMRRFIKNNLISSDSYNKSCGFENTLSLGCGGRSYLENLHFCTPYHVLSSSCLKEINLFLSQKNKTLVSFGYLLSPKEMLNRYVIKNLLHKDGIEQEDYLKTKQYCLLPITSSIFEDFPILLELQKEELIKENSKRIFLTEKGMSLSDAIGPLFISKEVSEKMKAWKEL